MKKFRIGTLLEISVASIIIITSLLVAGTFFIISQKSFETLVDNIIIQITKSIQKETQEYMTAGKQVNQLLYELFKKRIIYENKNIVSIPPNTLDKDTIEKIIYYYNPKDLINLFSSKEAYQKFFEKKVYQFSNIIELFKVIFENQPEINIIRFSNLVGEWIELKKMPDNSLSTQYLIPYKNQYLLFWNHENINYYYYDNRLHLSNKIFTSPNTYHPENFSWFKDTLKKDLAIFKSKDFDAENFNEKFHRSFHWNIPHIINFSNEIAFSNSKAVKDNNNNLLGVVGISMHVVNILYNHALEMKFNKDTHIFIIDKNEKLLLYSPEILSQDLGLLSFFRKKKIKEQLDSLVFLDEKDPGNVQIQNISNIQEPLYKEAFQEFKKALNLSNKKISIISQFQFNFKYDTVPYLGVLSAFSENSNLDWIVGILFPKQKFYQEINKNIIIIILISSFIVMLGFFIALNLASKISDSLKILSKRTELIAKLKIKKEDAFYQIPSNILEFNHLNEAFNNMILSLRSFKKYVPSEIVRVLLENSKEAILEGKQEILTIYFSDIEKFTDISENLSPQELVSFLSEYLEIMTFEIQKNEGTLDKYIGDAIMAFWGAPKTIINHAFLACLSAINNIRHLKLLNKSETFKKRNIEFKTRIGIHTGEVIVGNIGSKARINYTVMGDSVNLASRLEGLNKFYGTKIICSETTHNQISHQIATRKLDYVAVKGKSLGNFIYEIIELREFTPTNLLYFISIYEKGLELYLQGKFDQAIIIFQEALKEKTNDKPSSIMLERSINYLKNPPPKNWDGIYTFKEK